MIADFYSKPLQGKLFWLFCNVILNVRGSREAVKRQYQEQEKKRPPVNKDPKNTAVTHCVCAAQECVGTHSQKGT
eukprot:3899399-Ditylum_brightwellii.AAC.1